MIYLSENFLFDFLLLNILLNFDEIYKILLALKYQFFYLLYLFACSQALMSNLR